MLVMTVTEAYNNVLFTVSDEENEYRAMQFVERINENDPTIYASSVIRVGDQVLVVELPALLYSPSISRDNPGEAVSHIILGHIPPSDVQNISAYLVSRGT